MNEYDSDFLAQSLIQNGFSREKEVHRADLILINTCAVRAKPEQKACSFLGRMAALKEKNPELVVGMIGCLAQMKGKELMKRFPLVDFVMGPRELGRILEIVKGIYDRRQRVVATGLGVAPPSPVKCTGYFQNQTSGFISIMEGCNNFCSYCIVPYVRGREYFRAPKDILAEARHLLSEGMREITLLGQNVNSYAWEDGNKWNFASLLNAITKLHDLYRLRFTTSHPKDLSDDLLGCFKDMDKLASHIHLPFQAGSNRILKLMHRGYTREEYLGIIDKLRTSREDIAITSDVMVGFPGETEEDFRFTLDLMQQVEFDSLFSFKYSDREGTPAAGMPDKISEGVKASRLQRLQNFQNSITLKKNRNLRGRQLTVLVEGSSKKGGQLTGRTGSNKVVNFDGNAGMVGKLVEVAIKASYLNSLKGEVIGYQGINMSKTDNDISYKNEHVLVVDDEEIVREPIVAMLLHLGFKVDTAGSGDEALQEFKTNSYSFLLTDIRMSGIDGLELIRIVKRKYPDVCAIAMTGYAKEYRYVETINAGATDFINKPFGIEEIEAKFKRGIIERNIRQELNRLSITDSLTGLFNQRHFYDRLNEEIVRAERQDHDLALILLDLDDFKPYNDSFGHLAGDELLQKVGAVINSKMRQNVDSGYRYGGDEFAVMLIEADTGVAEMMSDRIKAGILKDCQVSASSGFAGFKLGLSPEALVGEADRKLYEDKARNKSEKNMKIKSDIR